MKILVLMMMMSLIGGCKSATLQETKSETTMKLTEAKGLMESGEFYRARKLTGSVLDQEPGNPAAQSLMAQILDLEIVKEKEIFSQAKPAEDLTQKEKTAQVGAWLERSETLLNLGEYDQALEAAENVFLYDPENKKASRLVDRIQNEGWNSGKRERQILGQMSRAEIDDRLADYRQTAERGYAAGEYGPALMALEKILILNPKDEGALRLKELILSRREQS